MQACDGLRWGGSRNQNAREDCGGKSQAIHYGVRLSNRNIWPQELGQWSCRLRFCGSRATIHRRVRTYARQYGTKRKAATIQANDLGQTSRSKPAIQIDFATSRNSQYDARSESNREKELELVMNRPLESEYAPYYEGYIAHVSETDILPVLRSQLDELDVLLARVEHEHETFRYAAGKWSIRQLVGHLIDTERVFGYRALCIARGEQQNLPGFDQNDYMLTAPYNGIELEDLLSELRLIRLGNIA